MKYAVEARIFNTGKIVVKMRRAKEGEESSHQETRSCDIWIDIFDTEKEADEFCREYKRA